LTNLEYHMLRHLPLDHPVRAHWKVAGLRVNDDGERW
jgi:hypothetical protein